MIDRSTNDRSSASSSRDVDRSSSGADTRIDATDRADIDRATHAVDAASVREVADRIVADHVMATDGFETPSTTRSMMTSATDPEVVHDSLASLSNAEMVDLVEAIDSSAYDFGDAVSPAAWEGLSKQIGDRYERATAIVADAYNGAPTMDIESVLPTDMRDLVSATSRFESLGGHSYHRFAEKQYRTIATSVAQTHTMTATDDASRQYASSFATDLETIRRQRDRQDPGAMSNRELLRAEERMAQVAATTDAAAGLTGIGNVEHVAEVLEMEDPSLLDYATATFAGVTAGIGLGASAVAGVADVATQSRLDELQTEIDRRITNEELPASVRDAWSTREAPWTADALNVAALATGATGLVRTGRSLLNGKAIPSGHGDLTRGEVDDIQGFVDDLQRRVDVEIGAGQYDVELNVVGGAARGNRRNRGTDLPVGHGEGTRSDIDYVLTDREALGGFVEDGPFARQQDRIASQLPDYDELQGLMGGTVDSARPAITFRAGQTPNANDSARDWITRLAGGDVD